MAEMLYVPDKDVRDCSQWNFDAGPDFWATEQGSRFLSQINDYFEEHQQSLQENLVSLERELEAFISEKVDLDQSHTRVSYRTFNLVGPRADGPALEDIEILQKRFRAYRDDTNKKIDELETNVATSLGVVPNDQKEKACDMVGSRLGKITDFLHGIFRDIGNFLAGLKETFWAAADTVIQMLRTLFSTLVENCKRAFQLEGEEVPCGKNVHLS